MKPLALIASLLLAGSNLPAADIRTNITDGKEAAALLSVIDPDKSVYGIGFGITEDKFIAAHGKPNGYLRLSGNETAMLYGKKHLFIFEEGKLVGVRITDSIMDWKLSQTMTISSAFDGIQWRLSNGIRTEMNLKEVKKILGDKLSTENYQRHYVTEKARIELDFSHHTNEGDNDEAYKVHGIYIRAK